MTDIARLFQAFLAPALFVCGKPAGKEGPAVSFPATAILKMPTRMPLEPDPTLSNGNPTPSARLALVHLPICTFDESFGEVVGKCKRAAD
jgi:hypothetical protein